MQGDIQPLTGRLGVEVNNLKFERKWADAEGARRRRRHH